MSRAILPEALESLRTPLSKIHPDPANPNKHPKRQIEQIALSLQEFGQHQPIVCDLAGVIAVGEGRYLAALALGWDDAAVVFVDDDELRRVRRNIADNQTARLAEMDAEALLALVQTQSEPVAGFDAQAVEELLKAVEKTITEAPEDFAEYGEDIETEFCCPKCGYRWSGKPA